MKNKHIKHITETLYPGVFQEKESILYTGGMISMDLLYNKKPILGKQRISDHIIKILNYYEAMNKHLKND